MDIHETINNIANCVLKYIPYLRHYEPFLTTWHNGKLGYEDGAKNYVDNRFLTELMPYFWISETSNKSKLVKNDAGNISNTITYTIFKELRLIAFVSRDISAIDLEICLIQALQSCASCKNTLTLKHTLTNSHEVLLQETIRASMQDEDFILASQGLDDVTIVSIDFTVCLDIPMIKSGCVCKLCKNCE